MINLFFSYSHVDEDLRDELEVHLAMLKRQGLVRAWHDRRIPPGDDIGDEISEHLESADVILLLVSPHFLASDYCYDVETRRALERHQAGDARVIPVILQPSDWKNSPFSNLRATPKDGKPVTKFPNIHDAFLQVTEDIRAAAGNLGKSGTAPEQPITGPVAPVLRPAAPRSSNLRVRKHFTDHHRDTFVDEAFEYIARFFDNSLQELHARNPDIEVRFKRESKSKFTATIYEGGEKRSSCRVWLPGRQAFGGDIAFGIGDSGSSNSLNDSMKAEDDGYRLGLKPKELTRMGSRNEELLTPQGAPEYFWRVVVSPLQ